MCCRDFKKRHTFDPRSSVRVDKEIENSLFARDQLSARNFDDFPYLVCSARSFIYGFTSVMPSLKVDEQWTWVNVGLYKTMTEAI